MMEKQTEPKWTVETLARYLWERDSILDCDGCRVEEECMRNNKSYCEDLYDVMGALGVKEAEKSA